MDKEKSHLSHFRTLRKSKHGLKRLLHLGYLFFCHPLNSIETFSVASIFGGSSTAKYKLPVFLKEGDKLYWLSTGAYTSTYASVAFNGFPPIKTYFMK